VEAGPAWVAITEANLTDWAGMYFTGVAGAPHAVMTLLSPRPDEPGVAVVSRAPRFSPWRTLLIGEKPGDLIESNLVASLNEPSEIKDTSWIRPGISAWDRWWSGGYAPDFDGKVTMSTASLKYYVDFAAEMGWKYQLVDWTWYGYPFDPAKPLGAAPNPKADVSKTIPELDLPELVRYAGSKGVKILLWLDWFSADKEMERVFPLYEKWGIAGVKVDFMQRDDQEVVNFYERLVKLAAKHHLMVDYHGAYKPTGMERTYPNLVTREGVMGNEHNKWSTRVTPTHNTTLPFTRMLCGPMDFTPLGFRNKTPKTFRIVGEEAPGRRVGTSEPLHAQAPLKRRRLRDHRPRRFRVVMPLEAGKPTLLLVGQAHKAPVHARQHGKNRPPFPKGDQMGELAVMEKVMPGWGAPDDLDHFFSSRQLARRRRSSRYVSASARL
jgi:alpha-glucosidase